MNFSSDSDLLASINKGDRTAFSRLYNRYAEVLFKYGFTLSDNEAIIKDHIQELFVHLWHNRTKLSNISSIKNYLFTAFRNNLLREIKSNRNNFVTKEEGVINSYEADLIFLEQQENLSNLLKEGIKDLSERQREVLHLKYYQGLPTAEIANLLSIKTQSVSNIIYRSLSILKTNIKK